MKILTSDETCAGKHAYQTQRVARRIARHARVKNVRLVPYHCNVCGQWHLTSREFRTVDTRPRDRRPNNRRWESDADV